MFAIQNCGQAVFPLVIAQVYFESSNHYIPNCEIVFVCFSSIAAAVGLVLCYYDCTHNGVFNSPSGMPVAAGDGILDRKESAESQSLIRTVSPCGRLRSSERLLSRDSIASVTNIALC